ncbi:MAG: hypothetical protein ACC655_06195 [Rhodothermia bacterium]
MNRLSSPRWHIVAFVLFATILSGCDTDNTLPEEDVFDNVDTVGTTEPRVVGVCFMLAETCVTPYVDLGPYEDMKAASKRAIPLYLFPSVPASEGGIMNPYDPDSLYLPYRLQNNVFAGEGRVWAMWRVYSADLNLMAAPKPGVWIWGEKADQTADFKSGNLRDLFANPYTSEKEILDAADAGLIKLVNLFKNVDCPVVVPRPEDIIVNLNPGFPVCE